MNASSPFDRSGWTRRLIVTLAIGSAAAAVTANVAFSERDAVGNGVTRTPAIATPLPFAATPDPSLPSAANALAVGADASGEATPTF